MTSIAAEKRSTDLRASRKERQSAHDQSLEKKIMGVPASIMRPRLIFIAVVVFLVVFGLVMIYSASSVKALFEAPDYNAFSYVRRQLIAMTLGLIAMAFAIKFDYHSICSLHIPISLAMTALLAAVLLVGETVNGATRWITIFGIQFQPSEIAKATVLLTGSVLAEKRLISKTMSNGMFIAQLFFLVIVPMALIFVEPDNGTTAIIGIMLLTLLFDSGFHRSKFARILIALIVIGLIIAFSVPYARERIFTMFNTATDTSGDGYQINQGFIAFGSGGLFGKGIGLSHQKYSFLPEAHTDFIYAVIGEELGLFGTLLVLAAFFLMTHEVLLISRQAPDKLGRFIALGAITLIITQFFINIMGVLGMSPLTGKPLPFLSYGGSSIISSLILAGLVINVSLRSTLPETEYDRRRQSMALAEEDTGVGEAHPRGSASRRGSVQLSSAPSASARSRNTARSAASSGLSVLEGGASKSSRSGGYERVDLGPSAQERLRSNSRNTPTVRKRGRGDSSRSSRNSKRS